MTYSSSEKKSQILAAYMHYPSHVKRYDTSHTSNENSKSLIV